MSWKTFINPCVIATVAGFLLFLFSLKLPGPLYKSVRLAGDCTTPLSMLVIGISLAQVNARQVWGRWRIYVTVFIRLIFLPCITGLCCRLLGIQGDLLLLAIIISAMPAATTTSIIASLYKTAQGEGSALVFISTLFSMATVPIVVLVLKTLLV
jgi:predicted permease